jgi:L,D-transpeptidase ErfK/SrfK
MDQKAAPSGGVSRRTRQVAVFTVLQVLLVSAVGQTAELQMPTPAQTAVPLATRPIRRVLVSVPDRKLAVLEDGKALRVFEVAVGTQVTPSPTGQFRIARRLENPAYYHPGVVIPAGRNNPLGPRWVGLSQKGFGIHGTNEPSSIGKAASHGCIRLRNRDIRQLFAMVRVGDVVEIRSERDAEMAQVFGGSAAPTVVAAHSEAAHGIGSAGSH